MTDKIVCIKLQQIDEYVFYLEPTWLLQIRQLKTI